MNPSRILRWHYVAAAALVGHCAATSLNAGAWWYGTGLFIAGLLFLVALARDIVAADRVCKAALDEAARVDRAARMRAWQDRQRAEIDGQTALRCNAATMHRPGNLPTAHGPHLWVVQPHMAPVRCPGTEAPTASQTARQDGVQR